MKKIAIAALVLAAGAAFAQPLEREHYPVSDPRSRPGDPVQLYELAVQTEKSGDTRTAIRVYRRAARAGSAPAAKRLGDIYEKGIPGIPKDHQEALQWYDIARKLGGNKP
jgi:TPR repeat protein